ncbi:hypothetical protein WA026_004827 [Henosepilachna vigintioctopunctata]|uniref:Malate dehydrogenase n=1 Tax=Henosepilachna vigintioctopunctata TaxID=420089 RepID=A0AAW1UWD3_9CUCU
MDDGSEIVAVADLNKFVTDCFMTIGVSKLYSEIMADAIVGADTVGHNSHGVYRLEKFLSDVESGLVDVLGTPKIEKETPATAWVDGQNLLGPVVGNFCMKLAIEKAKQTGAAIVVANNSNNFGVASNYSKQAADEGLIGLAFTNSSSLMLPTRAKYSITGTNPISLSAPGESDDIFLLDMATTVTSGGHIQIKYENGEYLPVGWAFNAACISETNADVGLKSGRFLPLGSYEEGASYKGTGLSIMVDILCGILGAAAYSSRVGIWTTSFTKHNANVGHCFIAINPDFFAPGFQTRMSEFMSAIRNVKPVDPNRPVRVAGDKRYNLSKTIAKFGGIKYEKSLVETLRKLSEKFKLKCVPFLPRRKSLDEVSFHGSYHSEADKLSGTIKFSESEEMLSVKEFKSTLKEIPFMIQDPSEWCCPFSEASEITATENLRKKRQRLLSMMYERRYKRATLMRSIAFVPIEKKSVYTDIDEIIETQPTSKKLF